ncbi:SapB/AmfS family lantipeptide [Streptomyces sp. WAC 06783]|nr:SapB/AmfS family lantipeptide [Streptomyces sp. WAC 06783]
MALLDLQTLPVFRPDYLAGDQSKPSNASVFFCPSLMTVIFC